MAPPACLKLLSQLFLTSDTSQIPLTSAPPPPSPLSRHLSLTISHHKLAIRTRVFVIFLTFLHHYRTHFKSSFPAFCPQSPSRQAPTPYFSAKDISLIYPSNYPAPPHSDTPPLNLLHQNRTSFLNSKTVQKPPTTGVELALPFAKTL